MALDLDQIEKRLDEVELPDEIRLSPCEVIRDVRKFFDSHITIMRSTTSKRIKKLHEDRMRIAGKAIKEYNDNLNKNNKTK